MVDLYLRTSSSQRANNYNHHHYHYHNKKNSMALSPQVSYTDSATSTCRRNLVPTFVDRGVLRGQRGGSPTVVNLSFLDRSLSL
jgi:hypothetical protein